MLSTTQNTTQNTPGASGPKVLEWSKDETQDTLEKANLYDAVSTAQRKNLELYAPSNTPSGAAYIDNGNDMSMAVEQDGMEMVSVNWTDEAQQESTQIQPSSNLLIGHGGAWDKFWKRAYSFDASLSDLPLFPVVEAGIFSPEVLDSSSLSNLASTPPQSMSSIYTSSPTNDHTSGSPGHLKRINSKQTGGKVAENWPGKTSGTPDPRTSIPGNHVPPLQEALYLRHWHNSVQCLLPDIFRSLCKRMDESLAIRFAVLALSASNFAHSQPELASIAVRKQQRQYYAPGHQHQHYGRLYYNLAIREFPKIDDPNRNVLDILTILLLFIYIETDIGSFRGLAFHHHGIEILLGDEYNVCYSSAEGRGLICAWLGLRATSWRNRIPFTVFGSQHRLDEMGIDAMRVLKLQNCRDEEVVTIMLESMRLSNMALFEKLVGRGDLESISSRCIRGYLKQVGKPSKVEPWRPKVAIPDEDYLFLLQQQQIFLDEWHASLPPTDLPYESFERQRMYASIAENDHQQTPAPLKFHSHNAAMNYVYYVFARIVQSQDALNIYLGSPAPDGPENIGSASLNPINPWLLVLLRITVGLNAAECIHRNAYVIGIFEILYWSIFRLPMFAPIIRVHICNLTKKFIDLGSSQEGMTSLCSFDTLLDDLEEERQKGRDVFFIIPGASADSEFNNQDDYCRQGFSVYYGKDQINNKMFCSRRKLH